VQIERSEGVVTITLDRPQKKNAMTMGAWEELIAAFAEISRRPREDRCVVITGAGGAFCSGQDLWEVGEGGDAEPQHQLGVMRFIHSGIQALHDLPQPTIAKVRGVSAGIGTSLAFGCDLVLASEGARFSEIFVRRGLSPDGGASWLLPRLIGIQKAKELAFFGDFVEAPEAHRIGLVNRVVADAELDQVVAEWAARLASGPPIALAVTKRMLNRSFEQTFEQALDDEGRSQTINVATRDTMEAILAFVEKRDPTFEGR
jgi:2-(1,2-epoxy-1,2-dihydrophenyl)acetyl-CoA isomerase